MITAKDIHRKKFEKVKFGYSPEEVDAFLVQLETDVKLMEQELADSNNKLQVLAEKVSEYKENEDDIRNALISAQKQARAVLDEAHEKAAQIEADARAQVDSVAQEAQADQEARLKEISAQLEQETQTLIATQKQVSAFKKSLFDMYKKHLEQISKLPETAPVVAPAEDQKAEKPVETEEAPAAEETADQAKQAEKKSEKNAEDTVEKVAEKPASSFGSRRDDKKKRS